LRTLDASRANGGRGRGRGAKSRPEDVAAAIIAGIENGSEEILADERARATRAELLKDDRPFDARMQHLWDSTRGK